MATATQTTPAVTKSASSWSRLDKKTAGWTFVACLVVIVLLFGSYDSPSSEAKKQDKREGGNPVQVTDQSLPPNVYAHWTVSTNTEELVEIVVQAGQKTMVSPVKNVAFDYYVDGAFLMHVPARKTGSRGLERPNIPYKHKEGFILSPGQGMSEVEFGMVKYYGATPADEDWWPRALTAKTFEETKSN